LEYEGQAGQPEPTYRHLGGVAWGNSLIRNTQPPKITGLEYEVQTGQLEPTRAEEDLATEEGWDFEVPQSYDLPKPFVWTAVWQPEPTYRHLHAPKRGQSRCRMIEVPLFGACREILLVRNRTPLGPAAVIGFRGSLRPRTGTYGW
jgi:hypothetical protein